MDDLIVVLLEKTTDYFQAIKNLQSAGRMSNKVKSKSEELLSRATRLLDKGWSETITLKSTQPYMYSVPSEETPGLLYTVCPAECFCSCPVGTKGHICKHLTLLDLLKDKNDIPDLVLQMKAHVKTILDTKQFVICSEKSKEVEVLSLCGRGTYRPSVGMHVCTCCTYSYHCICPCLILCGQIFQSDETVEFEHSENSIVQACSVSELVSEDQGCQSTVQKIEDTLKILKTWQTVPDNIKKEIDTLHANVVKENDSLLWSKRREKITSRKIQPLLQSSKQTRKAKRNLQQTITEEGVSMQLTPQRRRNYKAKHAHIV